MNGTDPTLVDWINDHVPALTVVSASEPAPVLLADNVIAVSDDPERARSILRGWERIDNADGSVGLIVMSRGTSTPPADEGVDPERVTGHALRRIVIGALPGALIGAVVVGAVAALLTGWNGAVAGAALGGAAFGAIAGAVWSFVAGTGWSAAYTEGFVPPDTTDVVIASFHSKSSESIAAAIDSTSREDGVQLYRIGSDGTAVPIRHR